MTKMLLTLITILVAAWYFYSHSYKLDHHASKLPKLDLQKFFDGELEGWGMFFDYKGHQKSTFYITLKGNWSGNKGKLEEWFDFDDGRKLERVWNLEFKDNGLFVGEASDVPGGAKGSQIGNAANIHYSIKVPFRDTTIELKMDDWMYGIDENNVINRTAMYKFGFQVGEMILLIRKKN